MITGDLDDMLAQAITWAREPGDGDAFLVLESVVPGRWPYAYVARTLEAAHFRIWTGRVAALRGRRLHIRSVQQPVSAFVGMSIDEAFVAAPLPSMWVRAPGGAPGDLTEFPHPIAEEIRVRLLNRRPPAVAVPLRPSAPTLNSRLAALLGSDWTWTPDVVNATVEVRHARGLWFVLSEIASAAHGEPATDEAAQLVADALLDAVEDGVKGQVRLDTWTEDGRLVRVAVVPVGGP